MSESPQRLKLALIQLPVGTEKSSNLERAGSLIREATKEGAQLVVLPECFNSPYGVKYFPEYAESIPEGDSCRFMSSLAKECEVFLVGGSIPEKSDGKLYNTCVVHGPDGKLIGKFRKMHLADVDIPGKIQYQESAVLSPGQEIFTFKAGDFTVGVGICYDIRFPELASIYNQRGCQLLIYPSIFNTVTGPMHWELLARTRAVDNQCYIAAVNPARDDQADYVAYGHSLLIDPWAQVINRIGAEVGVVYAELDLDQVDEVRSNIPISLQRQVFAYSSAQLKLSQCRSI